MVDESGLNRVRICACNRLFESEIGDEHIDRGQELLSAVPHELFKNSTPNAHRLAGSIVYIALDGIENGKQCNQLSRRHQRNSQENNFSLEAESAHPVPPPADQGFPEIQLRQRKVLILDAFC